MRPSFDRKTVGGGLPASDAYSTSAARAQPEARPPPAALEHARGRRVLPAVPDGKSGCRCGMQHMRAKQATRLPLHRRLPRKSEAAGQRTCLAAAARMAADSDACGRERQIDCMPHLSGPRRAHRRQLRSAGQQDRHPQARTATQGERGSPRRNAEQRRVPAWPSREPTRNGARREHRASRHGRHPRTARGAQGHPSGGTQQQEAVAHFIP